MSSFPKLKSITLEKADRCVKCGLCSAQCPTYLIDGSENESPRGRVSLAQALASGEIEDTSQAEQHINNCLLCQRCEKICPSGVEFGEIMASSRAILQATNSQPITTTITNWTAKRTHGDWKKIAKAANLLKKAGVLRLIPRLSPIHEYIKAFPMSKQTQPSTPIGQVSLFTGCTSHILDANTIDDARQLLNLCGYTVSTPTEQVCCGALPHHKGLLDTAKQCEQSNIKAFEHDSPIIFLATACGATLRAYDNEFKSRATNITAFLNNENALKRLNFTTLKKRILVHDPCSDKNTLKETGNTQKLLSHLPGAEVMSLKETTGCCGAAGDYMISHADNANEIRKPLIHDIEAINPDIIVTTNYTCGIHIQNGLKAKGLDIPVVHPIKLLLNQISIN